MEIFITGTHNADVSNIHFRRLLLFEDEAHKITEKEKTFLQLATSDKT